MMRIQSQTDGRPQPMPRAATGPFREQLIQAKTELVTAILAGQSCYLQGEDAPLRYRLLTDTALQLAELNQLAAYFDLSDLAYQYDFTHWVQNNMRLLAIQLNVPLPTAEWWTNHVETDPVDTFIHFMEEFVFSQIDQPILLSFDQADQLLQAPLAADFWRLLRQVTVAQHEKTAFRLLTIVLWGKSSWGSLLGASSFPDSALKKIIL